MENKRSYIWVWLRGQSASAGINANNGRFHEGWVDAYDYLGQTQKRGTYN